VTGAADLYSLAVIAYEMVSGVPPFTGATPMAVMLAHLQRAPPPPRAFLSLIHSPEPTRPEDNSYAGFCLKIKKDKVLGGECRIE